MKIVAIALLACAIASGQSIVNGTITLPQGSSVAPGAGVIDANSLLGSPLPTTGKGYLCFDAAASPKYSISGTTCPTGSSGGGYTSTFAAPGRYLLSSFATNGGNNQSDTPSIATTNGTNDVTRLILSSATSSSSGFTLLNTPWYTDPDGDLRDPSNTYWKGKYFVAYTCGHYVSARNSICQIESSDLQTWTRTTIDLPVLSHYTWAPEYFKKNPGCTGATGYSEEATPCTAAESMGMKFSTGTNGGIDHKIYYIEAAANDLHTWKDATGTANAATDTGTVYYDPSTWQHPTDGKYYQFSVVRQDTDHPNIQRFSATAPQGPYTLESTGDWTGQMRERGEGDIAVENHYEAPSPVQISATSLRLYFDKLDYEVTIAGICYTDSSSLNMQTATWSNMQCVDNIGGANNGVFNHLRHGTVLPVRDTTALGIITPLTTPSIKLFSDTLKLYVTQGDTTSTAIKIAALPTNGLTGTITFSLGGTITGLTPSFSSATVTNAGTTSLTIATASGASTGARNLTLVATSGAVSVNIPLTVLVSAGGAPIQTWMMHEGTGSTFTESVAANNATATNVTWGSVTGAVNPSALFDGTAYADAVNNTATNFTKNSAFSIATWVNFTDTSAGSTFLSQVDTSANGYKGWEFGMNPPFNGSNYMNFFLISSYPTNAIAKSCGWVPSLHTNHLFGVGYDGSGTAAGAHIYVDGVELTCDTSSDNLTGSTTTAILPRIGARTLDATTPHSGSLSAMKVWNHILSGKEWADLVTAGVQ